MYACFACFPQEYDADFEGPADVPAIERFAHTLGALQAIQPNLLIKFEDIIVV